MNLPKNEQLHKEYAKHHKTEKWLGCLGAPVTAQAMVRAPCMKPARAAAEIRGNHYEYLFIELLGHGSYKLLSMSLVGPKDVDPIQGVGMQGYATLAVLKPM